MYKVALVLLACLLLAHQTLSHHDCSGEEHHKKVGFSVSLTGNIGRARSDRIVIWNTIHTNVGNAFNRATGKFTAPVTGTYFFTMSVYKSSGYQGPIVNLIVDGRIILRADECCRWDQYDSSTNSVLLTLRRGQHVWTQLSRSRSLNAKRHESTFTGFLVFA